MVPFSAARGIAESIATLFENGEFDVCTLSSSTRFKSAMTQHVTTQQMQLLRGRLCRRRRTRKPVLSYESKGAEAMYILEPEETEILEALLPRNLDSADLLHALTENATLRRAWARKMTAMDNATRNAGDMIDSLTLTATTATRPGPDHYQGTDRNHRRRRGALALGVLNTEPGART